jgi:hypothetical protein
MREVDVLLVLRRGGPCRIGVGDPGLARDVDREPPDRRQEVKPARQMSLSAFPSPRGYIFPSRSFPSNGGALEVDLRGQIAG